jgi:hypothetical protein
VYFIVLIVLSALFLITMMIIGLKVFKIVRYNDLSILLIIVILNLCVMSKIVFYSLNLYTLIHGPQGYKFTLLISFDSPMVLITCAIGMNMRMWVIFFIKIGNMALFQQ